MTTSSVPKNHQPGKTEVQRFASMREATRPVLPHIGTYVIDTPRDGDWTWRQQCLQFHETHRGVPHSLKMEPLPHIPKRYDLKTLQDLQTRDNTPATPSGSSSTGDSTGLTTTTQDSERTSQTRSHAPLSYAHLNCKRSKEKQAETKGEQFGDKLLHSSLPWRGTPKRSWNREKTAGVPCYTSLCTHKEILYNDEMKIKQPKQHHSLNHKVIDTKKSVHTKQTEIKKDAIETRVPTLSLNLSPVTQSRGGDDLVAESTRLNALTPPLPPVKHVGHTSRHNEWSNMRLAELLKDRTAFSVQDQVMTLTGQGHQRKKPSRLKDEVVTDVDLGASDIYNSHSWLQMVNTPLVDTNIYDRYANVKMSLERQ
ncbi:uncharacterized protein LOC106056191 isoform X2 [Biomphalaria glabrata]|uniref:Uncharacterized protein LOC106056191 isoform X2 n=1 Tax=Biomphalaria glabrata TaxID=6526 RepID=A0A9W2YJL0_BIOGL|nr:uncharacterized protein LOC106056191 isoform X2 [Biomphalaria glabrata]